MIHDNNLPFINIIFNKLFSTVFCNYFPGKTVISPGNRKNMAHNDGNVIIKARILLEKQHNMQ